MLRIGLLVNACVSI